MKPPVIVAPHFRRMTEIFDPATLIRLHDLADVRWGQDQPMPQEEFLSALADATAVVFGTWHYGRHALERAGPSLQLILEVAGSHRHPELDYQTCWAKGIAVGSCAPAFGPAVAEMALALTLAAARLVPEGDAAFRRGEERWLHEGTEGATTLYGKTVGFLGAGESPVTSNPSSNRSGSGFSPMTRGLTRPPSPLVPSRPSTFPPSSPRATSSTFWRFPPRPTGRPSAET